MYPQRNTGGGPQSNWPPDPYLDDYDNDYPLDPENSEYSNEWVDDNFGSSRSTQTPYGSQASGKSSIEKGDSSIKSTAERTRPIQSPTPPSPRPSTPRPEPFSEGPKYQHDRKKKYKSELKGTFGLITFGVILVFVSVLLVTLSEYPAPKPKYPGADASSKEIDDYNKWSEKKLNYERWFPVRNVFTTILFNVGKLFIVLPLFSQGIRNKSLDPYVRLGLVLGATVFLGLSLA